MNKNRLRVSRALGFLSMVMMAFAFLVTFNCSTASAWYVAGQGWVEVVSPPPSPKIPANPISYDEDIPVGCYDAFTTAPLNCTFAVSIQEDTSPLSSNGGHTHSRIIGTGIGTLNASWALLLSSWEVRGQTAQTPWIKYDHPEMSGGVLMKGVVPALPGYACLPDGTLAACTVFYHIGFMVPWLAPLSPSPNYGEQGKSATHPVNHYGTARLNGVIAAVAYDFLEQTGRRLSINDMSLPQGGLYDFNNTGLPPHSLHRKGTSVDIGSVSVRVNQDINQPVDPKLQKRLTDLFEKNGCTKIVEAKIHYECD